MYKAAGNEDLKAIMAECFKSTEVLAKTLFPDIFYLPFSSKIHSEIFRLIDDDSKQKVAIAAPRGIGKTTIVNLVCPARGILFRERRYIIPISCSSDAAIEQSDNLKAELEANPIIHKLFGEVKSDKWSEKVWKVTWPGDEFFTMVRPRGAGQAIRGRSSRYTRPDLIIVDDLEDPEHMDSDEQRRKKKQWFFADVLNSVDMYGKNKNRWRIIVLGTILHEDSLLNNLLEDDGWESVRLEICDDHFNSNWEEAMSKQELIKKYTDLYKQGMPDVFAREFRNLAISPLDAVFKKEYFQRYTEAEISVEERNCIETVVIVDFAKTKEGRAQSAVCVVGVSTVSNKIYLRDIEAGNYHPDEVYTIAFTKALEWGAGLIAYEVTGIEEFVTYPFYNEMIRRGLSFEMLTLRAQRGESRGEGKIQRVGALKPLYRQGLIYHNFTIAHLIENQLLSYPKSRLWDIMDCFSYIVEILEKGMRYFQPLETEDDPYDIEMEYKSIEEYTEPALAPDWRIL